MEDLLDGWKLKLRERREEEPEPEPEPEPEREECERWKPEERGEPEREERGQLELAWKESLIENDFRSFRNVSAIFVFTVRLSRLGFGFLSQCASHVRQTTTKKK